MRLLGYTLIQYDWCLYEKHRRNPGAALENPRRWWTQRVEAWSSQPRTANGSQPPQKEGRHSKVLPSLRGSMALLTAWIWTPSLQNCEWINFFFFFFFLRIAQFIALCYGSLKKWIQTPFIVIIKNLLEIISQMLCLIFMQKIYDIEIH